MENESLILNLATGAATFKELEAMLSVQPLISDTVKEGTYIPGFL